MTIYLYFFFVGFHPLEDCAFDMFHDRLRPDLKKKVFF